MIINQRAAQAIALAFTTMMLSSAAMAQQKFAIAIHGGAGTISKAKFSPQREAIYRAKLAEATNVGYDILAQGGSSLDAINAAVNVLENSPYLTPV